MADNNDLYQFVPETQKQGDGTVPQQGDNRNAQGLSQQAWGQWAAAMQNELVRERQAMNQLEQQVRVLTNFDYQLMSYMQQIQTSGLRQPSVWNPGVQQQQPRVEQFTPNSCIGTAKDGNPLMLMSADALYRLEQQPQYNPYYAIVGQAQNGYIVEVSRALYQNQQQPMIAGLSSYDQYRQYAPQAAMANPNQVLDYSRYFQPQINQPQQFYQQQQYYPVYSPQATGQYGPAYYAPQQSFWPTTAAQGVGLLAGLANVFGMVQGTLNESRMLNLQASNQNQRWNYLNRQLGYNYQLGQNQGYYNYQLGMNSLNNQGSYYNNPYLYNGSTTGPLGNITHGWQLNNYYNNYNPNYSTYTS